jgi:hypothetical protein
MKNFLYNNNEHSFKHTHTYTTFKNTHKNDDRMKQKNYKIKI